MKITFTNTWFTGHIFVSLVVDTFLPCHDDTDGYILSFHNYYFPLHGFRFEDDERRRGFVKEENFV